jgi:hypothetical protein
LFTSYKDNQYTPSDFILDTLKPKINEVSKEIPIYVLDSTLYNIKTTKGFLEYFDLFTDKTLLFESSLVVINYINNLYVDRDCYLASLAKEYSCWDTVYINYPKIDSFYTHNKYFNYVVLPEELPKKLERILWQPRDQ